MKDVLKLKRKRLLLLLPIAVVIIIICRVSPFIAEYVFGRFIYRIIAIIVGAITRWFPFSIAEITIYILCLALLVVPIVFMVHLIKGKGRRKEIFLKGLLNTFCFASVFIFLFVVMCGTNYYRYSFKDYLNYDIKESEKEELYELCLYLADKVNIARGDITSEYDDGVMKLSYKGVGEFFDVASDIMSDFADDYPAIKWSTGAAKPVRASIYMSYTDIVGIFIPFTMEANVNIDVIDYNQPFDILHELAHLRGIMPEDEANYVAYLACVTSEKADFVYSGYMMAFVLASNKLYDEDKDLYYEARKLLSDDVELDLIANREYWKQYETPVGEVVSNISTQVNNTYLQINGQEEGVKSYGMMVDLLLAEFRTMRGKGKLD